MLTIFCPTWMVTENDHLGGRKCPARNCHHVFMWPVMSSQQCANEWHDWLAGDNDEMETDFLPAISEEKRRCAFLLFGHGWYHCDNTWWMLRLMLTVHGAFDREEDRMTTEAAMTVTTNNDLILFASFSLKVKRISSTRTRGLTSSKRDVPLYYLTFSTYSRL